MADFIYYRDRTGSVMRAKVRTRHRDGGVTVEPYFRQDADGCDIGSFQGGFRLRLEAGEAFATFAAVAGECVA